MSITASQLYRDSFNFLRNQLAAILLLSLFTAFITVLLKPDPAQMALLTTVGKDFVAAGGNGLQQVLQQMSQEQQILFLKASAALAFSELIGNTLLIGGVLTLIRLVSEGQRVSALLALGSSLSLLPRLLLLMFLYTLLVELGSMLLILPGLIIAVAFSLAPVMVAMDKVGIFSAMKRSSQMAYANARIIIPAMFLWIAVKALVLFPLGKLPQLVSITATPIIQHTFSNLISALLLIYLCRLYMLVRQ